MECQYCKKIFSTKGNLSKHVNSAKYCLKMQGKNAPEPIKKIKCEYCGEWFGEGVRMMNHKHKCIASIKIIKDKLEETTKDRDLLQLKVRMLEEQLDDARNSMEKSQSCIEDIARQPKISNTVNMMTPMSIDKDSFNDAISNKYNTNYLMDGQRGVARFAVDNLLRDEEGNLTYVCTDPSRHIYKFKTKNGEMERDVKAQKLTLALSEGILREKSHTLTKECMDCHLDDESWALYTNNFKDISAMKNDNGDFRNELASLTTVN